MVCFLAVLGTDPRALKISQAQKFLTFSFIVGAINFVTITLHMVAELYHCIHLVSMQF